MKLTYADLILIMGWASAEMREMPTPARLIGMEKDMDLADMQALSWVRGVMLYLHKKHLLKHVDPDFDLLYSPDSDPNTDW